MTIGKTIVLTRQTSVSKVMSLLFITLSRFVSSKVQASFNFMAAVTICRDFGTQENKICNCFHFSPFYLPSPSSWEIFRQVKKQKNWTWNNRLVPNRERSTSRLYFVTLPLFNLNAELDEAQAGIKIAGRNINNLRYSDDTTLMAESKEELKSLLMKVKEESEKLA